MSAVPDVSAIIICYNEERHIRRCLETLKWCGEIVVVDSFSTDATLAICREYTDKITQRPFKAYGDQKAFAARLATKEWIISLDADEWLSEALQREIPEALRTAPADVDGYEMPIVCYYLDRWWWRGGWYPDYKLRVFRRRHGTFDQLTHEKPVVQGRVRRLSGIFYHFPYDDISDHLRKINTYTTANAKALADAGRRSGWSAVMLRPLARFVYQYCLRRAFLEGTAGLFFALTNAFYVFLRYLKLREMGLRSPSRRE